MQLSGLRFTRLAECALTRDGDNYEVTIAMALALVSSGWRYGRDLLYLCFPHAAHDEKAWSMRLHLPMQLFAGIVPRASRSEDPLLQNPPE